MNKNEFMEMARECGFDVWKSESQYSLGELMASTKGNYCQSELVSFANAILERAAVECENQMHDVILMDEEEKESIRDEAIIICSQSIRSLKIPTN